MNNAVVRLKAFVEYHQFYLASGDMDDEWDGTCANDLIEPLPAGGAVVITGIALGYVRVEVHCSSDPPPVEAKGWDDIVEATIAVPDGVLNVLGWGATSFDDRNLAIAGPGMYRVRAHARDRLAQYDLSALRAKERFMFEIWPADGTEPPVVVLRDSGFASR